MKTLQEEVNLWAAPGPDVPVLPPARAAPWKRKQRQERQFLPAVGYLESVLPVSNKQLADFWPLQADNQ